MAGEKKEDSFLKKAFKFAVIGGLMAFTGNVLWQIFLDPIFFPVFHDPTNIIAQAWIMQINEFMDWLPQFLGLTNDPGFLSPLTDWLLSEEISILTPTDPFDAISSTVPAAAPAVTAPAVTAPSVPTAPTKSPFSMDSFLGLGAMVPATP